MKKICLLLWVIIGLQSYSYAQNVSKLEERMMDFFCQTLKQNYGKGRWRSGSHLGGRLAEL